MINMFRSPARAGTDYVHAPIQHMRISPFVLTIAALLLLSKKPKMKCLTRHPETTSPFIHNNTTPHDKSAVNWLENANAASSCPVVWRIIFYPVQSAQRSPDDQRVAAISTISLLLPRERLAFRNLKVPDRCHDTRNAYIAEA